MGNMQTAMLAAIPDAANRIPLSRQIVSAEQVAGLDSVVLERLDAAHAAEAISLIGRIELATDAAWIRRARQALRVLNLHRNWISAERAKRKKLEAKRHQSEARREAAQIKEQNRQATAELQARQHAERLARIKAANELTAESVEVFKEVAREVLGMEMYAHLWELVGQRSSAFKAKGTR